MAPARLVVQGSRSELSRHPYCADCSPAAARRTTSLSHALCSPAPSVPAPGWLALESPSDRPGLEHCDVLPETATADRFAPTVPGSWRPADHLCVGFLRSDARCERVPRSLRGPVRSTADLPTVSASPFPEL